MNNYEKIKAMSAFEFAQFLQKEIESVNICKFCVNFKKRCNSKTDCISKIVKWLKKEAE